MDDLELDPEEREILEAFERGELVPVADQAAVKERLQAAAIATLRKERRVNIRMTNRDLLALKEIALEEGIPYQTLISSILHKYVTGRFFERPRSSPRPTAHAVHDERAPYDE